MLVELDKLGTRRREWHRTVPGDVQTEYWGRCIYSDSGQTLEQSSQ